MKPIVWLRLNLAHLSDAIALDERDALAPYRSRFHIPVAPDGTPAVYLAGHSLGLQPKTARGYIEQVMDDWERYGVEAHFRARDAWMPYHRLLTAQTAFLMGAKETEVVTMNGLTVNFHLMMISFYRPTGDRHKVLIEAGAFPSDRYAVRSQIRLHGFEPDNSLIELAPRGSDALLRDDDIMEFIESNGRDIALILLPGVQYATGQALDIAAITQAGHSQGCVVGWDLAHAAGNLPLDLHGSGPDFAVWCSYKYLNGGPGCVGGCFVHERHASNPNLQRLVGWWGHDEETRFQMGPVFQAARGAEGWQLSNPPIVSLASLRASLELFAEVGMTALRAKSIALTGYLESLLDSVATGEFSINTPRDPNRRGAQLSIRIARNGRLVCDRLLSEGIVCDWREPDILRVAPVPFYNSFTDVYRFAERFQALLM